MRNILALILFSTLLSSCQSSQQIATCQNLDWFELGRSDGSLGLKSHEWQKRQSQCEGFSDGNHQSYTNGWYAGIDEFCSSQNGFAFGKSGQKYLHVCPSSLEEQFLGAYKKGLKVYIYESTNRRLSDEIHSLASDLESKEEKEKQDLKYKIQILEGEKLKNRTSISNIEGEMGSTTL